MPAQIVAATSSRKLPSEVAKPMSTHAGAGSTSSRPSFDKSH
jgi:hypothetical protein